MTYVFLAGIALVAAFAAYQSVSRLRAPTRLKLLRWCLAGVASLLTIFLALARRFELAAVTGLAAISIFRRGRLGPFSLGGESVTPGNASKVRSRYVAMELDHDSNEVSGRVIAGQFAGADLIDLDEADTRALIAEIAGDPDSLSLLESWLDANRSGWREYFNEQEQAGERPVSGEDAEAEAYAVLGLQPGASADQVRAAHRELMKALHPDRGGSGYLAAKINEARDLLLRKLGEAG